MLRGFKIVIRQRERNLTDLQRVFKMVLNFMEDNLRRIVRPSAHSGGKSWQKVGTGNF